jgi:uncharacterized lipoprotein YmbA
MNMKKTLSCGALTLAIAMVGLLFSGCGTSPAAKFYTLTPVTQQKQETSGGTTGAGQPVAIGPVEIPEYLDRPEIVTRADQNQLVLSELNLWGGALKADVNRVLIENISYSLASDGIPVVTWKIGIADTQRVPIQVVRFDGIPNDNIILKARWTVIGKDGKTFELVSESNISVPVKGGSYNAVVAAMSEALGELSKEIASGIKSVIKK